MAHEMKLNRKDGVDYVYMPSIDVSEYFTKYVHGVETYEERCLCLLLLLQEPNSRFFYITSTKVSDAEVDYVLSLIPGDTVENLRKRVFMVSCDDASSRPLAEKVLGNERVISMIREKCKKDKAKFFCYMHTEIEDEVAKALDLPFKKLPVDCDHWGSKIGSRQCFQQLSIPHCKGSHKNIVTFDELVDELDKLLQNFPETTKYMVKLNEGVSGYGNAPLEIPSDQISQTLEFSDEKSRKQQVYKLIRDHLKPLNGSSSEDFANSIEISGCIIEEMIQADDLGSPSVQGYICDEGQVIIVSTHNQVLDGQKYHGCCFPYRNPEYRELLHDYGMQVGKFLADKGATGEYGVDFVDHYDSESKRQKFYAIEINLRALGTTHPMCYLELVTGGKLHKSGSFFDREGRELFYIASDNFEHPALIGLHEEKFTSIVREYPQLQYQHGTSNGPIFYLLGCLRRFGKLGYVYIDRSPEQAKQGFDKVKSVLLSALAKEKKYDIKFDQAHNTCIYPIHS